MLTPEETGLKEVAVQKFYINHLFYIPCVVGLLFDLLLSFQPAITAYFE